MGERNKRGRVTGPRVQMSNKLARLMEIQIINNFLSQLLCIELCIVSSHIVRPFERNGVLDFKHQTRVRRLRPARGAPETRVEDMLCRGLDLIQDLLALLFNLQSFRVSTAVGAKPGATSQCRESTAAHACSFLRPHASQTE